jgi:hypothetical protein
MRCVRYETKVISTSHNFLFVILPFMEGGSNTSTAALRVVRGDGKGTKCRGYNWVTLILGDINRETWPSRLRKSRIWDIKIKSWVPRDSDLQMTALARPVAIVIDRPTLLSGRCYIWTMTVSIHLRRICWPWVSWGLAPRRTDWR